MSEFHDVIIVGAGASGLMCACLLGASGADVAVLDKNVSAGRKLLATGNGRCNFTNRYMDPSCYYGDSRFVGEILGRVDDERVIRLFEGLGIYHRERDGCCYPGSGQASAVTGLLVQACEERGVSFFYETKVSRVVHKDKRYDVFCRNGKNYRCRKLVLATGGKAYESLGGDGSGYKLCRSLSHRITNILPGLTGLQAEGREWRRLAGVRMRGEVSLYDDGRFLGREAGEIQIVKDGISGIPVFQLCRLAAVSLAEGRDVRCRLDLFPEMEESGLVSWLQEHGPEKLEGLVNRKWAEVLRDRTGGRVAELAHGMKDYEVVVTDTFGLERAQVTAGGVVTDEVDPQTMQSVLHEGLYIIGELLDVDGRCGGYNLHFAWSTADICARAIKEERGK